MIFEIVWGILSVLFGILAWLGQALSAIFPKAAEKAGLTEAVDVVDPAFYADIRGEAWWDIATLWVLPAAGLLLVFQQDAWHPLGMIGGGVYLYFSGRGIATRITMLRRGIRIGSRQNTRAGLALLAVWGVIGLGTIILSVTGLYVR